MIVLRVKYLKFSEVMKIIGIIILMAVKITTTALKEVQTM
jgi:hypothetical protein